MMPNTPRGMQGTSGASYGGRAGGPRACRHDGPERALPCLAHRPVMRWVTSFGVKRGRCRSVIHVVRTNPPTWRGKHTPRPHRSKRRVPHGADDGTALETPSKGDRRRSRRPYDETGSSSPLPHCFCTTTSPPPPHGPRRSMSPPPSSPPRRTPPPRRPPRTPPSSGSEQPTTSSSPRSPGSSPGTSSPRRPSPRRTRPTGPKPAGSATSRRSNRPSRPSWLH